MVREEIAHAKDAKGGKGGKGGYGIWLFGMGYGHVGDGHRAQAFSERPPYLGFGWVGRVGIFLCYARIAKPMKISPSTIAGVLVASMVVGFMCGLVYVVNYLLSQR